MHGGLKKRDEKNMAKNVIIDKKLKQIAKLNKQVEELRSKCPHNEYVVISVSNDHDGYSRVVITWHELRRCILCDERFSINTGEDRSALC